MIGRLVEHEEKGWSIIAERLVNTYKLFALEDGLEYFDNDVKSLNSKDSPKILNNLRWLNPSDDVYLKQRHNGVTKVIKVIYLYTDLYGEYSYLIHEDKTIKAKTVYIKAYKCIWNKVGKDANQTNYHDYRTGKTVTSYHCNNCNYLVFEDEQGNELKKIKQGIK